MLDDSGHNFLDRLSPAELTPALIATTTILRVLTVFSLFEDAAEDGKVTLPSEPKFPDFCVVMRDLLCETWRLFYLLFRRILGVTSGRLPNGKLSENSQEHLDRCLDLLSLVHEELGVHKWCGYGNGTDDSKLSLTAGKLLALMIDQFLNFNTGEADPEILQCMFCLYGISVSVHPPLGNSN